MCEQPWRVLAWWSAFLLPKQLTLWKLSVMNYCLSFLTDVGNCTDQMGLSLCFQFFFIQSLPHFPFPNSFLPYFLPQSLPLPHFPFPNSFLPYFLPQSLPLPHFPFPNSFLPYFLPQSLPLPHFPFPNSLLPYFLPQSLPLPHFPASFTPPSLTPWLFHSPTSFSASLTLPHSLLFIHSSSSKQNRLHLT